MSYSNTNKKSKKTFFNFLVLCMVTLFSVLTFTACKLVNNKTSSNSSTDINGNLRLIAPVVNFHAFSLNESNEKIIDENSGSFTWELSYYDPLNNENYNSDQASFNSVFYIDEAREKYYNSGKYGGIKPFYGSYADAVAYFAQYGVNVSGTDSSTDDFFYGLYQETPTSDLEIIKLYTPSGTTSSGTPTSPTYPNFEVVVDGKFYTFKVTRNGSLTNGGSKSNPYVDTTGDAHNLFTFEYRVGKSSSEAEFIDCPEEFMTYYTGEDGRFYIRFNPRLEEGSTNRYIKVRALPQTEGERANSLYSSTVSYEAYSMTFTTYSPNSVSLNYGGLSYNENAYYFHKVKTVYDSINNKDYINTLTGVFPEGRQVIVTRTTPMDSDYDYAFQSWTTNTKPENSRVLESTLPYVDLSKTAKLDFNFNENASSIIPVANKKDSTLFNSISKYSTSLDASDSGFIDALKTALTSIKYYEKSADSNVINNYAHEIFVTNTDNPLTGTEESPIVENSATTGSIVVSSHYDLNGYTFYANYAKVRDFSASGTFFAGDNFFTGNDQYLTGVTAYVFNKNDKKIASTQTNRTFQIEELNNEDKFNSPIRTNPIVISFDGAYFTVTGLEHGDTLYFEKEGAPLITDEFTASASLPYEFHSAQMVKQDNKYLGRKVNILSFQIASDLYSDRQDLGIIGTQYAEESNLVVNLYQTTEDGDTKQIEDTNLKLLSDSNVGYEIIKSVSSYEDINGFITTNVIISVLLPSNCTLVSYNVDTINTNPSLLFEKAGNYYFVDREYNASEMSYSNIKGIYNVEVQPITETVSSSTTYVYIGENLYVYSHKAPTVNGTTYYYEKVNSTTAVAEGSPTNTLPEINMVAHFVPSRSSSSEQWQYINYIPVNPNNFVYQISEDATPELFIGSGIASNPSIMTGEIPQTLRDEYQCAIVTSSPSDYLTVVNNKVSVTATTYATDIVYSKDRNENGNIDADENQNVYVYYDTKIINGDRYLITPIAKRESTGKNESSGEYLYEAKLYFSEITNFDALLAENKIMLGEDIAQSTNSTIKAFYESLGSKIVLNCYYYVQKLGAETKVLVKQYIQEVQSESTEITSIYYLDKNNNNIYDEGDEIYKQELKFYVDENNNGDVDAGDTEISSPTEATSSNVITQVSNPILSVFKDVTKVYKDSNGATLANFNETNDLSDKDGNILVTDDNFGKKYETHTSDLSEEIQYAIRIQGLIGNYIVSTTTDVDGKKLGVSYKYYSLVKDSENANFVTNAHFVISDLYYNGSSYHKITSSRTLTYTLFEKDASGAFKTYNQDEYNALLEHEKVNYVALESGTYYKKTETTNTLILYTYDNAIVSEGTENYIIPSFMLFEDSTAKQLYYKNNGKVAVYIEPTINYKYIIATEAVKQGTQSPQEVKLGQMEKTAPLLETSLVRSAELVDGTQVTVLGKYIHNSDSTNAIIYPSFSTLNVYTEEEAFTLVSNEDGMFDHYYSLDYTSRNLVIEGFPGVKLLAGPPYPNPVIYFSVRHKKTESPVINVSFDIKEAYYVEIMGTKISTSDSNVIRDFTTYAFKDTITNLSLNNYIDKSYQILDAKTLDPIIPYIYRDGEYEVYLIDSNGQNVELGIQDVGYNEDDDYIYFTNLVGDNGKYVNKVYVESLNESGNIIYIPLTHDMVVIWKSNAVKIEDVAMYDIHSYYQDNSGMIYFNSGLDTSDNIVCIGLEGISAGSTTNPNNVYDYSQVLISGVTNAYRSKTSMIKGADGNSLLGYWLDSSIPIINAYNSSDSYFLSGKEACVVVASPQIVFADDGGYEYIYRFKEWQVYSRYNSETLFYNRGVTEGLNNYRYNAILPFDSSEAGYFVIMPVYERVYSIDLATAVVDGAINQGGGVVVSYANGEESKVQDSYEDTLYLTEYLPTIYNNKEGYYYGDISSTPYLWFTGKFTSDGQPIFGKNKNVFAVSYAKSSGIMQTRNNGENVFFFYELNYNETEGITAIKPLTILNKLEAGKAGLVEVKNYHGTFTFLFNTKTSSPRKVQHFDDTEGFYLDGVFEKDANGNDITDKYLSHELEQVFNYVFTSNFFYDGITSEDNRSISYRVSLYYDEETGYFYNLDFSKFMGLNILFGNLIEQLQGMLNWLNDNITNPIVNAILQVGGTLVSFVSELIDMLDRQLFTFIMLLYNFQCNPQLFSNDGVVNKILGIIRDFANFTLLNEVLTVAFYLPVIKAPTEMIKDFIIGDEVNLFAGLSYYLTDTVAKVKTKEFTVIDRATNPYIDGMYVSNYGSLVSGELTYDENGKLNSTLQYKSAYIDRDSYVVLNAVPNNGYRLEGWYASVYDEEARVWYLTDEKLKNSEPVYSDQILQAYHNTFNDAYYYITDYYDELSYTIDGVTDTYKIYYLEPEKLNQSIVPDKMLSQVRGYFINEGTKDKPNYVQVFQKGTSYSHDYYYDANFTFPVELDEDEEVYELPFVDAINQENAANDLYTLSNVPIYKVNEGGKVTYYRLKEDGNIKVDGSNLYISKLHSNVRYVAKFIETYTQYIFSENADNSGIKVEAVYYNNSDPKKAVNDNTQISIRTDSFGNNKTGYDAATGGTDAYGDPTIADLNSNSNSDLFKQWFNNKVTFKSIFKLFEEKDGLLLDSSFESIFTIKVNGNEEQHEKYIGLEELKNLNNSGLQSDNTTTQTYRVNAVADESLNGTLSLKNMIFDVNTTAYVVVSVKAGEALNIHSLGMNPQYKITPILQPTEDYENYISSNSEEADYMYYVLKVTYDRNPENELASYIVHPTRADSMAYDVLSGNYLSFYNEHFDIYLSRTNTDQTITTGKIIKNDHYTLSTDANGSQKVTLTQDLLHFLGVNPAGEVGSLFMNDQTSKGGYPNIAQAFDALNRFKKDPDFVKTAFVVEKGKDATHEANQLDETGEIFAAIRNIQVDKNGDGTKENQFKMLIYSGQTNIINISSLVIYNYNIQTVTLDSNSNTEVTHALSNNIVTDQNDNQKGVYSIYVDGGTSGKTYVGIGNKNTLDEQAATADGRPFIYEQPSGENGPQYTETKVFSTLYTGIEFANKVGKNEEDNTKLENLPIVENTIVLLEGTTAPKTGYAFVGWYEQKFDKVAGEWSEPTLMSKNLSTPYLSLSTSDTNIYAVYKEVIEDISIKFNNKEFTVQLQNGGRDSLGNNIVIEPDPNDANITTITGDFYYDAEIELLISPTATYRFNKVVTENANVTELTDDMLHYFQGEKYIEYNDVKLNETFELFIPCKEVVGSYNSTPISFELKAKRIVQVYIEVENYNQRDYSFELFNNGLIYFESNNTDANKEFELDSTHNQVTQTINEENTLIITGNFDEDFNGLKIRTRKHASSITSKIDQWQVNGYNQYTSSMPEFKSSYSENIINIFDIIFRYDDEDLKYLNGEDYFALGSDSDPTVSVYYLKAHISGNSEFRIEHAKAETLNSPEYFENATSVVTFNGYRYNVEGNNKIEANNGSVLVTGSEIFVADTETIVTIKANKDYYFIGDDLYVFVGWYKSTLNSNNWSLVTDGSGYANTLLENISLNAKYQARYVKYNKITLGVDSSVDNSINVDLSKFTFSAGSTRGSINYLTRVKDNSGNLNYYIMSEQKLTITSDYLPANYVVTYKLNGTETTDQGSNKSDNKFEAIITTDTNINVILKPIHKITINYMYYPSLTVSQNPTNVKQAELKIVLGEKFIIDSNGNITVPSDTNQNEDCPEYYFVGWYINGELITLNSNNKEYAPTSNMILEAKVVPTRTLNINIPLEEAKDKITKISYTTYLIANEVILYSFGDVLETSYSGIPVGATVYVESNITSITTIDQCFVGWKLNDETEYQSTSKNVSFVIDENFDNPSTITAVFIQYATIKVNLEGLTTNDKKFANINVTYTNKYGTEISSTLSYNDLDGITLEAKVGTKITFATTLTSSLADKYKLTNYAYKIDGITTSDKSQTFRISNIKKAQNKTEGYDYVVTCTFSKISAVTVSTEIDNVLNTVSNAVSYQEGAYSDTKTDVKITTQTTKIELTENVLSLIITNSGESRKLLGVYKNGEKQTPTDYDAQTKLIIYELSGIDDNDSIVIKFISVAKVNVEIGGTGLTDADKTSLLSNVSLVGNIIKDDVNGVVSDSYNGKTVQQQTFTSSGIYVLKDSMVAITADNSESRAVNSMTVSSGGTEKSNNVNNLTFTATGASATVYVDYTNTYPIHYTEITLGLDGNAIGGSATDLGYSSTMLGSNNFYIDARAKTGYRINSLNVFIGAANSNSEIVNINVHSDDLKNENVITISLYTYQSEIENKLKAAQLSFMNLKYIEVVIVYVQQFNLTHTVQVELDNGTDDPAVLDAHNDLKYFIPYFETTNSNIISYGPYYEIPKEFYANSTYTNNKNEEYEFVGWEWTDSNGDSGSSTDVNLDFSKLTANATITAKYELKTSNASTQAEESPNLSSISPLAQNESYSNFYVSHLNTTGLINNIVIKDSDKKGPSEYANIKLSLDYANKKYSIALPESISKIETKIYKYQYKEGMKKVTETSLSAPSSDTLNIYNGIKHDVNITPYSDGTEKVSDITTNLNQSNSSTTMLYRTEESSTSFTLTINGLDSSITSSIDYSIGSESGTLNTSNKTITLTSPTILTLSANSVNNEYFYAYKINGVEYKFINLSLTINENTTIEVMIYKNQPTFTYDKEQGTVTLGNIYNGTDSYTFTVEALENYRIKSVSINGSSINIIDYAINSITDALGQEYVTKLEYTLTGLISLTKNPEIVIAFEKIITLDLEVKYQNSTSETKEIFINSTIDENDDKILAYSELKENIIEVLTFNSYDSYSLNYQNNELNNTSTIPYSDLTRFTVIMQTVSNVKIKIQLKAINAIGETSSDKIYVPINGFKLYYGDELQTLQDLSFKTDSHNFAESKVIEVTDTNNYYDFAYYQIGSQKYYDIVHLLTNNQLNIASKDGDYYVISAYFTEKYQTLELTSNYGELTTKLEVNGTEVAVGNSYQFKIGSNNIGALYFETKETIIFSKSLSMNEASLRSYTITITETSFEEVTQTGAMKDFLSVDKTYEKANKSYRFTQFYEDNNSPVGEKYSNVYTLNFEKLVNVNTINVKASAKPLYLVEFSFTNCDEILSDKAQLILSLGKNDSSYSNIHYLSTHLASGSYPIISMYVEEDMHVKASINFNDASKETERMFSNLLISTPTSASDSHSTTHMLSTLLSGKFLYDADTKTNVFWKNIILNNNYRATSRLHNNQAELISFKEFYFSPTSNTSILADFYDIGTLVRYHIISVQYNPTINHPLDLRRIDNGSKKPNEWTDSNQNGVIDAGEWTDLDLDGVVDNVKFINENELTNKTASGLIFNLATKGTDFIVYNYDSVLWQFYNLKLDKIDANGSFKDTTLTPEWNSSRLIQLRIISTLNATAVRPEKKFTIQSKIADKWGTGTAAGLDLPEDYLAIGFDEDISVEFSEGMLVSITNLSDDDAPLFTNLQIAKVANTEIAADILEKIGENNIVIAIDKELSAQISNALYGVKEIKISYILQNYVSDEDRYIEITKQEATLTDTSYETLSDSIEIEVYDDQEGNWISPKHKGFIKATTVSIRADIPTGYYFKGFLVVSGNYKTSADVFDINIGGNKTVEFNNYNLLTDYTLQATTIDGINIIKSAIINDVLIDGNTHIYALYEPTVYIISISQHEYFEDNLENENEALQNPFYEIVQNETTGADELKSEFSDMFGGTIEGTLLAQKGEDIKLASTNYQYITFVGWMTDETTFNLGTSVAVDVGDGQNTLKAEEYYSKENRYHDSDSYLSGNLLTLHYQNALYAYLVELEQIEEGTPATEVAKQFGLSVNRLPENSDRPNSSSMTNNLYLFNVQNDMTLYAFYKPVAYDLTIYLAEILSTITYESYDQNGGTLYGNKASIDTYLTYADHVRAQEGWVNPSAGTYEFTYNYGTKGANAQTYTHNLVIKENDPYVYAFNDSDGNDIYQYVIDNINNAVASGDNNDGTFRTTGKRYPTKIPSSLINISVSKQNNCLTYIKTDSTSDSFIPVDVAYADAYREPRNTVMTIPDPNSPVIEGQETPTIKADLVGTKDQLINGQNRTFNTLNYIYNSNFANAGDELYRNGYGRNQSEIDDNGTPVLSNISNYLESSTKLKEGLFTIIIRGNSGEQKYESNSDMLITEINKATGEVSTKLKIIASEYGFPEVVITMGSPDSTSKEKQSSVIMKNSIEVPNYNPTSQQEIANNKGTQITGFHLNLYGNLDFTDKNLILPDLDVTAIIKWQQTALAVDAIVNIDENQNTKHTGKSTKLTGNQTYENTLEDRLHNLECVTSSGSDTDNCSKIGQSTVYRHKYEISNYFLIIVENGRYILDKLQEIITKNPTVVVNEKSVELADVAKVIKNRIESADIGNITGSNQKFSGISNLATGQLLDSESNFRNIALVLLQTCFPNDFSGIDPSTFLQFRVVSALEYYAGGINRNFIGNYANSYDLIVSQVVLQEHQRMQYDNKYLKVWIPFVGFKNTGVVLDAKQGMDYYRYATLAYDGNIQKSYRAEYKIEDYIAKKVSTGKDVDNLGGITSGDKKYEGTFNRIINSLLALSSEDFQACFNAGSVTSKCNVITHINLRAQTTYHHWDNVPASAAVQYLITLVPNLLYDHVIRNIANGIFGADWGTAFDFITNLNFDFQ